MTTLGEIDFLDFGASKGGSIEFAKRRLRGGTGVGVDIDPNKVARMRSLGYRCLEADITKLDLLAGSVRFVVMSHVLEHLPDFDAIRRTISSAARVARDFLYIQGPFFDADAALASQGFKFYWSDWHGHTYHLTTWELIALLHELGLPSYVLQGRSPVGDSMDAAIHPLSSPRDQHGYETGTHPPKERIVFGRPVHRTTIYREFVCTVRLRDFAGFDSVVAAREGCEIIDSSFRLL